MAASIELTATADVKSYLGLSGATEDARIALIVTAVSQWIESYCHREFMTKERSEYFNGGSPDLNVKSYPISRTASLVIVQNADVPRDYTDSDDALDTDEYTVDYEAGMIHYEDGSFLNGVETVKATYTGGVGATTAALPEDLQQAAIFICAGLYNRAKQGGDGLISERLGPWAANYVLDMMTDEVKGILWGYMDVRFA